MKRIEGQKGFTLVEGIIVVSIVAILSAVAIPNLTKFVANNRLRAAARSISSDILDTRYRAIGENVVYRMTFDATAGTYTIEQPAGTILQTQDLSAFKSGMQLVSTNFSTAPTYTNFQTRGTVGNGTIVLRNNRGATATITINITGKTYVTYSMQ